MPTKISGLYKKSPKKGYGLKPKGKVSPSFQPITKQKSGQLGILSDVPKTLPSDLRRRTPILIPFLGGHFRLS